MKDYAAVNRANWDERVPAHAASPDYSVDAFLADPAFLSDVVRFDLPLLGDISGQRGVHLQCHIGTDTISLARLGASMTGVDFSGPAVRQARALAEQTGADATFVESDVYEAADAVGRGAFDFVFTGIGALCWLPSVSRWARVVADVLRPGGRLFIREGHPDAVGARRRRGDDLLVVEYPYFERDEPTIFDDGRHLRRHRHGVRAHRHARVEPRPRRDHFVPARRRDDHHWADRARQRAVGRVSPARWNRSAAGNGG